MFEAVNCTDGTTKYFSGGREYVKYMFDRYADHYCEMTEAQYRKYLKA